MIREVKKEDAKNIVTIYNHYITSSPVTLEERAISTNEMGNRIQQVLAADLPWLVAEKDGKVIGFAYARKWNERSGYRFTVRVAVYLSMTVVQRSWGSKLYKALLGRLKEDSVHTVIGVIPLPNPASIRLHEKFGMEKVGHLKEGGFKFDKWIDVGFWQKTLND